MSLSDEALLEHLNKHPELRSRVESMLLVVSGQRRPQPPSAHRTVRTGPYTAPHARRIH